MVKTYKSKVVKSGNLIQVYNYTIPLRSGYEIEPNEMKGLELNQETGEITKKPKATEKLEKYKSRIINNLVRTINCNINHRSKFLTLTFKDTVLDNDLALKELHQFLQNFKREFGEGCRYVAVQEPQKKRGLKEGNSGSIHFHLVIFNEIFLKYERLKKCWKKGSLDIKRIDKVDNIGRYMSKYLWKDIDLIKPGKHSILKSKGLLTPTIDYLPGIYETKKEPTYFNCWSCYSPTLNGDLEEGLSYFSEYRKN